MLLEKFEFSCIDYDLGGVDILGDQIVVTSYYAKSCVI